MAVLSEVFAQTIEGDFVADQVYYFGSGTLPAGHTLILQCVRTDTDNTTEARLIGDTCTVDGVVADDRNALRGYLGNIHLIARTFFYQNTTGQSIDLTDAVGIIVQEIDDSNTVGEAVFAVKALSIDIYVKRKSSAALYWNGSLNLADPVLATGDYMVGYSAIADAPATALYTFTATHELPSTTYTEEGMAPNAGGANLGVSLEAYDWLGVADGLTCSIDGSANTTNVLVSYIVFEEDTYVIVDVPAGVVSLELMARPGGSPPSVSVGQEFEQKYSLSVLHLALQQPYSDTLQLGWTQPYGSLSYVQGEEVTAKYKLGFDDAAMECVQSYGMSVSSAISQLYGSLQFVQNDIAHTPYKLGFDEVSKDIDQPYSFMLEAEFSQAYASLLSVAQQWPQPYTDSVEVAAEVYSPYTLVENDLIMFNLTSHYTMYLSDNVVVVNTSSGLTYKSGYTAELET